MKRKLAAFLMLALLTLPLRAGLIDGAIKVIWDTARELVEKAKEYGASDMLKTLELLDQIACLQDEFELNFRLYEKQMGCAMKIKYATAVTNIISARQSISDYYTDLKAGKNEVESSKSKIQRINEYLEKAIVLMQDFNKMVEYDAKEKIQEVIRQKQIEKVSTYTILK